MTTKKERAAALKGMTKAELIRTINTLDKRQTQLLNQIAALTAEPTPVDVSFTKSDCHKVLDATLGYVSTGAALPPIAAHIFKFPWDK